MQNQLIAEIVTFRAAPGVPPETMRSRAEAIGPWLAACPGFLSRALSLAEDGTWTDHVIWASLDQAMAAAAKIMDEPCAAPFMAAIDGPSVAMGHAPVLVRQAGQSST